MLLGVRSVAGTGCAHARGMSLPVGRYSIRSTRPSRIWVIDELEVRRCHGRERRLAAVGPGQGAGTP